MAELTVEELITMPKRIIENSSKDFKEEHRHLKRDFRLLSADEKCQFRMFLRKHIDFQESFSIGADFLPADGKTLPLIRCNGLHDVTENPLKPEPHCDFHIHMPRREDLDREMRKLSFAEVTDKYASYKEALDYMIKRANIQNANEYLLRPGALFGEA